MKRLLIALVLALVSCATFLTPAQAAVNRPYEVCNSSVSVGLIAATDGYSGAVYGIDLGDCYLLSDYGGRLRIDPDPEWGQVDVDSYVIGEIGHGYRSTWVNSESEINPPDAWEQNQGGDGIRVKTDYRTH